MLHKETKTCQVTGKTILSESQASRKQNHYNDITGYYYCQHCKGYHLTSKTGNQKFKILKQLLHNKGIQVSNRRLKVLIWEYRNWGSPIHIRIGTCLDEFDSFLGYAKKRHKHQNRKV